MSTRRVANNTNLLWGSICSALGARRGICSYADVERLGELAGECLARMCLRFRMTRLDALSTMC